MIKKNKKRGSHMKIKRIKIIMDKHLSIASKISAMI
jgi:hypothetical protein